MVRKNSGSGVTRLVHHLAINASNLCAGSRTFSKLKWPAQFQIDHTREPAFYEVGGVGLVNVGPRQRIDREYFEGEGSTCAGEDLTAIDSGDNVAQSPNE